MKQRIQIEALQSRCRRLRACLAAHFCGSIALNILFALLSSAAAGAAVINIDFKGIRNVPGPDVEGPTYVGSSPVDDGTVWCGIVADSRDPAGGLDRDNLTVGADHLKDSKGNQTTVGFQVGPVGGDVGGPATTVAASYAALFSDYIFNNSAGNSAGESPFTISGLPGATADLYFYRTSGGVSIAGQSPTTFPETGIFTSGNTICFKNVPISNGAISGTIGSGTAVITGLSIVCAGDFNPTPVSFVSEPASQTVIEGDSATFTAEVKNIAGVSFQWWRNGQIIPGAASASFTIDAARLSDNGTTFRVSAANVVSNLTYTVISSNATLTVSPDTTAPALLRIWMAGPGKIALLFSERMERLSAADVSHYRLSGAGQDLEINKAELSQDGRTLFLTVTGLAEGNDFLLHLEGLKDNSAAGNVLAEIDRSFRAIAYELAAVGTPGIPGSLAELDEGYELAGAGQGARGVADQLEFARQELSGDFDMQARVESVASSNVWAFGGLMVRESIEPNSRFAAVLATPSLVGSFFASRAAPGAASAYTGSFPVNFPCTWLRLRRAGNQFTGFASMDGRHWRELGAVTISLPQTVLFGLAAASGSANAPVTARFQDAGPAVFPDGKAEELSFEPLAQSSRKTSLVISEIMYHPVPAGSKDLEFIELFNANPFFEDISGFRLSGEVDFVFPEGTILPGGAFLVVAKAPADVEEFYGISGVAGPFQKKLSNSGGSVRLRNKLGAILLEVDYGTNLPWPISADGAGLSLVL
jgi:hypothetical protein